MSRRALLRAGGASAALGALGVGWRRLDADSSSDRSRRGRGGHLDSSSSADPRVNLANIQGNVLAGFNKDHQRLLFFRVGDAAGARQWLSTIVDETATCAEVLAFNDLFRRARSRRGGEVGAPQATWLNVALTHPGLAALGVPAAELASFPQAFREGMATRAPLIGDVDDSAPSRWVGPFASPGVHGLLLLAGDDVSIVDRFAQTHTQRMAAHGVTVVFDDTGTARADDPGHEHFGFKDGISQPGIRGVTRRQNPDDDNQGQPGQDLLWPGEFVLGYPTQIPTADRSAGEKGANENPGPISVSGPTWTADGSFLAFRRLRQDVAGFRRFLADAAAAQRVSVEHLGAKLVGRYTSGAPLERTKDARHGFDPSIADPSIKDPTILDDQRVNNFEFADDDADGALVPRAAHIRKAYPRNERTPQGGEADTQTHRIIRRGIPYGESFRDGAPPRSAAGAGADRGLLFLGYQASLERQFEFVMAQWFNRPDHPERGDGHDPLISQTRTKTFTLPGGTPAHLTLQPFIFTTGGAYLFQPSISALQMLAGRLVNDEPAPSPVPGQPRGPRRGPIAPV